VTRPDQLSLRIVSPGGIAALLIRLPGSEQANTGIARTDPGPEVLGPELVRSTYDGPGWEEHRI